MLLLLLLYVVYPTITTIEYSLNHVSITADGLQMRFTAWKTSCARSAIRSSPTRPAITLKWVVVVTLAEVLLGRAWHCWSAPASAGVGWSSPC